MKNAMTVYVQAGCMPGTVGNKESFTLKMWKNCNYCLL